MKAAALALLALFCYSTSLSGGFLWDDDQYVVENETLTAPEGLKRIWLDPSASPQYYPLVFTSFRLERRLWGLDPAGYRAVNLALHLASALLLWSLLARLGAPWPWFAAALFVAHPVHVESVAWISERKNVLSGALTLGSAWAYLRMLDEEAGPRRALLYGASGLMFLGALLSKTVACSLPAAILVALWWKRGRLKAADVVPLAPFFAAGLCFALVTAGLERTHVGAAGADWDLSASHRVLIAGRALWFYLGKLIWPHPLAFIYPRWTVDPAQVWQWAFPAAALGLLAALRARRGALACALYFGGTLVPALGFFDVYPMLFSFVADHFQYLASLGPLALAAAGLARLEAIKPRAGRAAAGALLALLAGTTWARGRAYRDLEGLWNDTLAKYPGCWMCLSNLGGLCQKEGRRDEAIRYYERVLELRPRHFMVRNDLGALLFARGDLKGAEDQLREALAQKPDLASAHTNLGAVLYRQGRFAESVTELTSAVRLSPASADARDNLAAARAALTRRASR